MDKKCSKCHEVKPTTQYGNNAKAKDGLAFQCRDCKAAWNAQAREKGRQALAAVALDGETNTTTAIRVYVTADEYSKFMDKFTVNADSGCWEWDGSLAVEGYGWFNIVIGGAPRAVLAHRVSYAIKYGYDALPPSTERQGSDSIVLDHLCCNRRCVNPTHLEPVTVLVNSQRAVTRAA